MNDIDLVRAATTGVAFAALYAGHYLGDQWIQTAAQACKKSLDRPDAKTLEAHWHCAKHVFNYTLSGLLMFLGAAAWLNLPVRPGWLAAGIALNAITHYVVDLRSPLMWMAKKVGRMGYVEHCQVVRPTGPERVGPGTGAFHLDQAWHFIWIFFSALLIAGA
jgi:hypothetical protein